jgi:hypothetical protein
LSLAEWTGGVEGLDVSPGLLAWTTGFDQMGLREIWAQAPSAHQRALRVLQRLRFTETGRGDDCAFLDQPTHYRRFAITAVDWATSRGLVFRDVTQPPQQGGHRGT